MKTVNFHPLQDFVLVEKIEQLESEAGLHLPVSMNTKTFHDPANAIVVASGPGRFEHGVFVENQVKPGDRICVIEAGGQDGVTFNLMLDDKKYQLIHHKSICAVIPQGQGN